MDSPASYRISVPGSTQVPSSSPAIFAYGTVTLFGRLSHTFLLTASFVTLVAGPYNPAWRTMRFGLFPFRSPLLGELSLFLWVLRCFSSPGSPLYAYVFSIKMLRLFRSGFPHSDIPGLSPVHGYPRLFAVSHVLLRHSAPRHPP